MHEHSHGHSMYLFTNSIRSKLANKALSRQRRDVIAHFNVNYPDQVLDQPEVQYQHQSPISENLISESPSVDKSIQILEKIVEQNNPRVLNSPFNSPLDKNLEKNSNNNSSSTSFNFNFDLGSLSVSIPMSTAVIITCVAVLLLISIPYVVWRVKKHARSQLNPILNENFSQQCQLNRKDLPPPPKLGGFGRSASTRSSILQVAQFFRFSYF